MCTLEHHRDLPPPILFFTNTYEITRASRSCQPNVSVELYAVIGVAGGITCE